MKVTPEILKKYAEKQCSEKERNVVEEWLRTTSKAEAEEEIPTSLFLEEKLWANIKRATTIGPTKKQKVFQRGAARAIAASIVLFIGLGAFLMFFRPDRTITYQTLAGEIQVLTLSDGTVVHLNANSILKGPKEFTADTRTVSLLGEAYFEVAKDSIQPFIVQTENSRTTVLGTKFNLSAYPYEDAILTLDEGKVSFRDRSNAATELILLPHEQGILNNGLLKKDRVNTEHYTGWKRNILYFNNDPFSLIARKIARIYGIKVLIKDEQLKKQQYRGMYKKPALKNLLDDLSFVLKFNYSIDGDTIIIY